MLTAGLDPEKFETTFVTGRVCNFEGDMSYLLEEYNVQLLYSTLGKYFLIDDIQHFLKFIKSFENSLCVHTHKAKSGALGRVAAFYWCAFICHTFHGHVFHGYLANGK